MMQKMSVIATSAMSRSEMLMICVLIALNFSLALDKQVLSALGPMVQKDYGFSLIQFSMLISATSWTYALMQMPSGWLAERFGPKMLLVAATAGWSAVTLLIPLASGFTSFLLLRILLGAGQAPDWPASVLAISRGVASHRRSKATSNVLSAQYFGLFVGGPIAIWLSSQYGWPASFYLFGMLGFLLSLLCLKSPWLDYRSSSASLSVNRDEKPSYRSLIGSVQFWAIGFCYFSLATILGFYWGMLPTYLVSGRGFEYHSIYWLISLPYLMLWAATLLAGRVGDMLLRKTGSIWLARVPLGAGGTALAGVGMALMLFAPTPLLIGVSIAISMTGIGMAQVATWSSVQDIARQFAGQLAGWVTFCGHLAHGTTLVAIAWLVGASGSWTTGMFLPVTIAALGACSWLCTSPQKELSVHRPA